MKKNVKKLATEESWSKYIYGARPRIKIFTDCLNEIGIFEESIPYMTLHPAKRKGIPESMKWIVEDSNRYQKNSLAWGELSTPVTLKKEILDKLSKEENLVKKIEIILNEVKTRFEKIPKLKFSFRMPEFKYDYDGWSEIDFCDMKINQQRYLKEVYGLEYDIIDDFFLEEYGMQITIRDMRDLYLHYTYGYLWFNVIIIKNYKKGVKEPICKLKEEIENHDASMNYNHNKSRINYTLVIEI